MPQVIRGLNRFVLLTAVVACASGCSRDRRAPSGNDETLPLDAPPAAAPVFDPAMSRIVVDSKGVCALLNTDRVRCWDYSGVEPRVRDFGPFVDPVQIVSGDGHACVLEAAGSVTCWGINVAGQVGNGTPHSIDNPEATVRGLDPATRICAGYRHTCALLEDGSVACWGLDDMEGAIDYPRDPDTGAPDRSQPTLVRGLDRIHNIACGKDLLCATHEDGGVSCLGSILWQPPPAVRRGPERVEGIADIVELTAGDGFACGLDQRGEVWCWGSNVYGPFAPYPGKQGVIEKLEHAPSDIITLDAGAASLCMVTAGDELWCWGEQAPAFSFGWSHEQPTRIEGEPVLEVSVGWGHVCRTTTEPALRCLGQLWTRSPERFGNAVLTIDVGSDRENK